MANQFLNMFSLSFQAWWQLDVIIKKKTTSLTILVSFLFITISLVFSILVNFYFSGFLQFFR